MLKMPWAPCVGLEYKMVLQTSDERAAPGAPISASSAIVPAQHAGVSAHRDALIGCVPVGHGAGKEFPSLAAAKTKPHSSHPSFKGQVGTIPSKKQYKRELLHRQLQPTKFRGSSGLLALLVGAHWMDSST